MQKKDRTGAGQKRDKYSLFIAGNNATLDGVLQQFSGGLHFQDDYLKTTKVMIAAR
jgi:hypothetical protein